jgi:hypothetical protein
MLVLEDEIYDFYRKLLSGLPDGAAVLTRHPSKDPGGEDIELVPANSNCARIYVHPMADRIYASMGQSTSMEFFLSWKKETQALESLKEVSRAVVDGKFSEDIWMLDGKIVKSEGTFEINGKMRKMGGLRTFFNPLRRKQKQHFDYLPYVQVPDQLGMGAR